MHGFFQSVVNCVFCYRILLRETLKTVHMQKKTFLHTSLLLLVFWLMDCFSIQAQLPQDLKITNYDGSTGFYSRVVRAMLKDANGFLWIGTSDGLYRYDGFSFRNYRKLANDSNSLAENYIIQLAAGKDRKIWMGLAKGGVSSFDPATGRFRNYLIKHKGKPVTGAVTMLLVDHDNEVWLGISEKGLWHLDATTGVYTPYEMNSSQQLIPNTPALAMNTIGVAVEGKPGILWLGTYHGLYEFNTGSKKLKAVREKPLDLSVFRDDDFISIALDGDIIWLGSWAGGLSSYHTITHEWNNFKINIKEPQKYTTNIISGIRIKSANELWITSNDKGLGIFDKKKKTFHFYSEEGTHALDIPATLCYEVETDKNDNLWLMHEWGLSRIQPREKKFQFIQVPVTKTDNGAFYYVRDLMEDKDHIFIATTLADGLHVKNKKTGLTRHFPVKVMPGEEPFLAVYKLWKDSKGNIWVVSRDYIYQYNTQKEKLVLINQPSTAPLQRGSNQFNNITEDKQGNIWITSLRNGVFRYDVATGTYQHFFHDPKDTTSLSSDVLTAVAADIQGRVWVGGPSGCFAYFDPLQRKFIKYTFYRAKGNEEAGNNITSLLADRNGTLWAGSDMGLVEIDITKEEPQVKKVYTAQEGLRGDLAYSIQQDAYGNIWCTTTSALCMINTNTKRVSSILFQNDILKTITARVYLSANENKVNVLSYSGYYSFDPATFKEKQKDSVITITSFRVKDKEYYYEEQLKNKGRIFLNAAENLFTFEFAVLDFSQSDDRQYAYMLEGFDKTWINAGSRRYASYTNIPGGKYTFKVRALDAYGDANSAVISIPMQVGQPFYTTWWFILLMSLSVGGMLYLLYRFRLEKQREILLLQTKAQALEKEKTQVQYENLKQHLNPHFLFNSLTSLSSLIRIDQKMAGDFLDAMSRIYRYILQSKDSELVSLKEEIRFIQTFIGLQKTRFADGLDINIRIDEEYYYQKIVPVTLQNLVENAIKHNIVDSDTPLVIDMFVENGYLLVRNNMQKKKFVETSNKQGLDNLLSLYKYLSDLPMVIEEDEHFFTVKIPLI